MASSILLLDDDDLILESFAMIFSDLGYRVETFADSRAGAARAAEADFDLILTDIRMPGLNGAQAVEAIVRARPGPNIHILTAYPGDPLVHAALESGAKGIMKKPFEIAKILDLLQA